MPKLTAHDLPFTCERVYERAEEIMREVEDLGAKPDWTSAIFAATAEARKVEERLH